MFYLPLKNLRSKNGKNRSVTSEVGFIHFDHIEIGFISKILKNQPKL